MDARSNKLANQVNRQQGAAMYELLGALAFAILIAGYVLAVVFVRFEADEGRRSPRQEDTKVSPFAPTRQSPQAPVATE